MQPSSCIVWISSLRYHSNGYQSLILGRCYYRYIGTPRIVKTHDDALNLDKQIGMARIALEGYLHWGQVCTWAKEMWPNQQMG